MDPAWARRLLGLALVTTTGCAAPELTIAAKPAEAMLFVDGRAAGTGQVTMPLPYYGTLAAQAVRPRPPDRTDAPNAAVRAELPLPEPASPWLFPLDFVVELVTAPFREARHRFVLEVPAARSEIVPGLEPARLEELRVRAARARVQRGTEGR